LKKGKYPENIISHSGFPQKQDQDYKEIFQERISNLEIKVFFS
jgi:hypothetical protein